MPYTLRFESHLSAPPAQVWQWITSFAGISKEMSPYLHMSAPRGVTGLGSVALVPGQRLFRSWITLFHVLPVDYSDLTLERLEEGVGFVEQSPMGSMRTWRHVRRISPASTGCVLTDELTFEPRLAGALTCRIVRAFFRHRHRMLRRHLSSVA